MPEFKPDTTDMIPGGSERILLVDDEISLLQAVAQMLERLGYKVAAKANAREALELFSREPGQFDLVITDFTMPHMTGIQLAGKIAGIRADIPIILCSGFSYNIPMEKLKNTGISNFIMKPVNKGELARMIRNLLKTRNGG
ncbi:MAG: response regulator [bacterium]|nr:response regulator [bacterium]